MKTKIQISEIDCYIGNANRIDFLATNKAVQHQIIINDLTCGRKNKPSDEGRYERIVLEKNAPEELGLLMLSALEKYSFLKSEICNTIEEYKEAQIYNEPIKKQLWEVVKKMHNIDNLGLSIKEYYNHLVF